MNAVAVSRARLLVSWITVCGSDCGTDISLTMATWIEPANCGLE